MQITQISTRTTEKLLLSSQINPWLLSTKFCCCRGMAVASATKPSAVSKGVLDELRNHYWAKVLVAEEEALQNVRPWQQLDFVPIHAVKEEDIRKPKKGQFLHKNYTFGKPYVANVLNVLNKFQTSIPVKPLHYPFEPSTEPPPTNIPLDLAQWRQAFTKARIYLLGVLHNSRESQEDAVKLVEAVQPDILMFELCLDRKEKLLLTDAQLEQFARQPFEQYREHLEAVRQQDGYPPASLCEEKEKLERMEHQMWRKSCEYHEMLLHQGDEFRAAFMEAKEVPGCAGAVLGDNLPGTEKIGAKILAQTPIYHFRKYLKAWRMDRAFEKFQVGFWNGVYTDKEAAARQAELVEQWKQLDDNLDFDHFLHARNRNMIRVLHTIAHRCTIEKFCASQRAGVPFEPLTVVALVGAAHLFGITHEWAKPEVVYGTTTTMTTKSEKEKLLKNG